MSELEALRWCRDNEACITFDEDKGTGIIITTIIVVIHGEEEFVRSVKTSHNSFITAVKMAKKMFEQDIANYTIDTDGHVRTVH